MNKGRYTAPSVFIACPPMIAELMRHKEHEGLFYEMFLNTEVREMKFNKLIPSKEDYNKISPRFV